MLRNPLDALAIWAALAAALSIVLFTYVVEASEWIPQDPYSNEIKEAEIDICGSMAEENVTGRIYVEFIGQFDSLSDAEVVDLQSVLADVYSEASRDNCRHGFRALDRVEIDRSISFWTPTDGQFRMQLNVLAKCKGCSQDLRFFSTSSGRTQGRFLEEQLLQNGVERTLLGSYFNETKRNKVSQEYFLDGQPCFCSPPSRDRIVQGIRDRIKIRKEEGKLIGISDVAYIGAYASDSEDDGDFEIGPTNTSSGKTCAVPPPFSSPIALADDEVFNVLSTCPFRIHEQVSGEAFHGCYPMYTVPNWNSTSLSFMINPIQGGPSLRFEKEQGNITGWEELIEAYPGDPGEFESCFKQLRFDALGVNGEISGGNGTASWSAVVVSFGEQNQTTYILLPFGGCEGSIADGHGRFVRQRRELQSVDLDSGGDVASTRRSLQDSSNECSIRPTNQTGVQWNDCLEICYTVAESAFSADMDKLTPLRSDRLLKNKNNEEIVIEKMYLARASQVALALARCKCASIPTDELGACILHTFLDVVANEADLGFEAEEIFGQHQSYVESWYETSVQHACVVAIGSAMGCHTSCKDGG